MHKHLLTAILFLFTLACQPDKPLEGEWILAYRQVEESPRYVQKPIVMSFRENTFQIAQFTGTSNELVIEQGKYKVEGGRLKINTGREVETSFEVEKDELFLTIDGAPGLRAVFKKLDPASSTPLAHANFEGSFILEHEDTDDPDPIFFLNDSLLIHTGDLNLNDPVEKYQLMNFSGHPFLIIQNDFGFNFYQLRSKHSNAIELTKYEKKRKNILLKPQALNPDRITKNQLYGRWEEIVVPGSKPPLPPGVTALSQMLIVTIDDQKIKIKQAGQTNHLAWNLTPDGRRIYFMEKIHQTDASWKIASHGPDTLEIRRMYKQKPETVQLARYKQDSSRISLR